MNLRKKSATLGVWQKRLLYGVFAVLWLTGAVWLYQPHPFWLKVHGVAAMAFLMSFGALLLEHVPTGWDLNEHRPSGGSLLGASGVLILTGWGLYYFGNEEKRSREMLRRRHHAQTKAARATERRKEKNETGG